jgi:alkanesulfonate monooxygenase SsuD/methylene tetrahydromethanopterin reductase-like flavin-dependent oxidoreductase (luciferase family)
MGGHAPEAIARAGRLADGWIRSRASTDIDAMRHHVAAFEAAAREAGRDLSKLSFTQIRSAFVWDDGDAWSVVRDGLAHAVGVYAGWEEGGDTPGHGFVLPEFDEGDARATLPIGTPQEVAHRLRPVAEAFGGRRDFTLVVRLHYPGMDYDTSSHAVELFGEQVIPALKGA